LKEINKNLQMEIMYISKEKDLKISKIKSEYDQKQSILEKNLSLKLDQEKKNSNRTSTRFIKTFRTFKRKRKYSTSI